MARFFAFWRDARGAIAIDWVTLTAGILLLGVAVVWSVFNQGVDPLVDEINSTTTYEGVDVGDAPSVND